MGYLKFDVLHPLRCYHCQRYGHPFHLRKGKHRCPRCGNPHSVENRPISQTSPFQLHCVNCEGSHSVSYGGCPVKILHAKIRHAVNSNISHKDAAKNLRRKLVC